MKILFVLVLMICSLFSRSQDYTDFKKTIHSLSDTTNFHKLKESGKIPFVSGDSVAFLYQGKAESVVWMGDFNGWGYDKAFQNQGKKIPNTNIWILKTSVPKNARLDYKILVDENNWILDPVNPHQQWSGVGGGSPNSELRMPEWKEGAEQKTRADIAHGIVKTDLLFNSKILNYQVTYGM
jgi:hypothetical protein